MKTKSETVKLELINIGGGTQARERICEIHVSELSEHLENLPPLTLFFDGATYWLADGFHRYHAYRKAGKLRVACEVIAGTLREAILYAAGANPMHGLKRSVADKRKAVEMLVTDEEWARKSDNWIAEKAHVSFNLVKTVRDALGVKKEAVTIGKDGRERKTGDTGKKAATPDASTSRARSQNPPDDTKNADSYEKPPAPALPDDGGDSLAFLDAPAPAVTLDREGHPVTEKTREAFANGEKYVKLAADHLTQVTRLVNEFMGDAAASKPIAGGEAACKERTQVLAYIANIRNTFRQLSPHSVCPYCLGVNEAKCTACKGLGWVCVSVWNSAPSEKKAAMQTRKAAA